MARTHARIALRTEGVALLLDVAGGLPVVLHWGADIGDQADADFEALVVAGIPIGGGNLVSRPPMLAVLPEHWTGWMGRPGISGSRGGRDWSPKFAATAVRVDGTDLDLDDDLDRVVNRGPALVEVDATDPVAGLALTVRIELAVGGVLRLQATLTNTLPELYQLDDLVLALPVPQTAREVFDLAGRWGKERTPQRSPLTVGTHLREGRKGRTGAGAATVLHVGEPGFGFAAGEVWGLHTGWSGNHTHYAEREWTGVQVIGGGELLLPGEVRLGDGESYTSPWVYGSYGVGLDAVARRFHRFLRARPDHPDTRRPVTLNTWEAVYFDHDLDRLSDLAERAAALGVERFVLDDGWFGARRNDRAGLGDWTVSAEVWPDGLHPLVDVVTGLGMQFGLWFEPEMINLDSEVARAHPDWVLATGDRLPVESRFQQVINLGIPECYAHVRDAILALLEEYRIGYIKWDHNRDLVDAGTAPGGRAGVHAQTLAVYRLLDEIRAAHPDLEIESCSSGGARVDLGILQRTDRVWVSDCIDPLERQQMNRWTTQLIPPELMGSHVASGTSHTTGRHHELGFRAESAVFGHFGIEWDLARATDEETAELREWIEFYKAERDLLLRGDLVRLDHPDDTLVAHGVVAADRSRGIFSVCAVASSDVTSLGRLQLPGLDPTRRYRVRPVLLGQLSHHVLPPAWWGLELPQPRPDEDYEAYRARLPKRASEVSAAGTVVTGAVLASVGLMLPAMNPEQAVLLRVDAV